MDILAEIISRLNERAGLTGLFNNLYGLCEITKDAKDKNKTGFSFYNGNGQAQVVTNFDNNGGTLFWLKRGSISASSNIPDAFKAVSCEDGLSISIPLRGVAMVRKSELPCDSATSADQLAQTLIKNLIGKDKDFRVLIQAKQYEVISNGYSTNNKEISGNLEFANCYFDITIQVLTSVNCLPDICGYS